MHKLTTLALFAVCSTLPARATGYTYINQPWCRVAAGRADETNG